MREMGKIMNKRIFIMGQCTLHWGRMEYGNIGNYYIVKPMFEELRRVFPDFELVTTMQFSKEFCGKYNIITVPMEWYYDFRRDDNLQIAKEEYEAVCKNGEITSDYINEIKKSNLVIDFSGDIWGDNADFLGKDRFETGLYKDMTAQYLKPTVMISGSPGPFNRHKDLELIKNVFAGFTSVINREHVSTKLLREMGFDLSKEKDFPCPSFLFKAADRKSVRQEIKKDKLFEHFPQKIGIILCGWNFEKGPYDIWPREDNEYTGFVKIIENLIEKYQTDVYLLSHSNGFDIPPAPFKLKHGRDFPIMSQLYNILKMGKYASKITLLEGVYSPEITKGIIANFDMLISGRMHGAVAGLSQAIPTVIIDYGHEPKAHKLQGFAEISGMQDYIADPNNITDMMEKTEKCFENRIVLQDYLKKRMIHVKKNARLQFDYLRSFC